MPSDSIIRTRTCCGVSVPSSHQRCGFGIGAAGQIDVGRRPHPAAEHAFDGLPHLLDAERLRNEARGAEIHAAADHRRVVVGRHHHHRNAGILCAQIHQSGETTHAGHGQIEQNQIDLADLVEQLRDLLESPSLCDFSVLDQPRYGLTQGAAEQRMIVGYHQAVVRVAHVLNLQYSRRAMHVANRPITPYCR